MRDHPPSPCESVTSGLVVCIDVPLNLDSGARKVSFRSLDADDAALAQDDRTPACRPTNLRLIGQRCLPSLYKTLYCLTHEMKP